MHLSLRLGCVDACLKRAHVCLERAHVCLERARAVSTHV